jgi:hypothetical protein
MVSHPDPRQRSKRLWCFRTKLYRDVKGATAYFELPNTICLALDACFDKDSSKTYKLCVGVGECTSTTAGRKGSAAVCLGRPSRLLVSFLVPNSLCPPAFFRYFTGACILGRTVASGSLTCPT